ncbi:hypothetical protein LG331_16520 [Vreelandella aquamarina]|uniref:type I restriction endonuclease subunit R, EcoR124 family n=1 Tax=Vreelandella aquamarina TaxID=77097 RepID=UPI00384EAD0E
MRLGGVYETWGDSKARKSIMDVLDTEAQLRSKKELIERFIKENFAQLAPGADVSEAFDSYWTEEKHKAMVALSQEESLKPEGLEEVIGAYLFTEKTPMRDDVIEIMETRPGLRERRSVADRVIDKIKSFVETFIEGVD